MLMAPCAEIPMLSKKVHGCQKSKVCAPLSLPYACRLGSMTLCLPENHQLCIRNRGIVTVALDVSHRHIERRGTTLLPSIRVQLDVAWGEINLKPPAPLPNRTYRLSSNSLSSQARRPAETNIAHATCTPSASRTMALCANATLPLVPSIAPAAGYSPLSPQGHVHYRALYALRCTHIRCAMPMPTGPAWACMHTVRHSNLPSSEVRGGSPGIVASIDIRAMPQTHWCEMVRPSALRWMKGRLPSVALATPGSSSCHPA